MEPRKPVLLEVRIDPAEKPLEIWEISFFDGINGWRTIRTPDDARDLVALIPPELRSAFIKALSRYQAIPQRNAPERIQPGTPEIDTSDVPITC